MNNRHSYRERIYKSYVSARDYSLAPNSPAGLSGRSRYLRRLINLHFPRDKNAKIFEIGCGHGALLYFAKQAGYLELYGVDGSAEQIAAAVKLGIDNVVLGDLFATMASMANVSQDVIIAFDVLEHFTRDEAVRLVDEIHRVLKPSGRLILHLPNGESPFFGRVRYGDLTHEMAYTSVSLTQLLASSGFKDIACFEDRPIGGSMKGFVRLLLWKIIRSMLRFYLAVETGDVSRSVILSQNLLCVAFRDGAKE